MGISPHRPSLYRTGLAGVILVFILAAAGLAVVWAGCPTLHAQGLIQQYGRKPADTGPRALGLVQLSSTGKARIIPIAILMNGKFYDAGSYKATPVPMALDFGVVYEAFRTGVSQGLFTITQPGQLRHDWIAEGTWLPAGAKPPETSKKYAPPVIEEENKDDRPVLHRRAAGAADKEESKPAAGSTTAASTSTPATSTSSSTASTPSATTGSPSPAPSTGASAPSSSQPSTGTSAPSTSSQSKTSTPSASSPPASSTTTPPTTSSTSTPASAPSPSQAPKAESREPKTESQGPKAESREPATRTSDLDQPINDPNRPILRRGKPNPNAHHEPFVDFDEETDTAKSAPATGAASATAAKSPTEVASIQTFTAISDAAGPDPRPYTYDLKPAEETIYRNKMLDLAATLVKLPTQGGGTAASVGTGALARPAVQTSASSTSSSTTSKAAPAHRKTSAAKTATPPKPQFENVSLRIFDLSSSNEPVLVLSARTPVPPAGSPAAQVRASAARKPSSSTPAQPVSSAQGSPASGSPASGSAPASGSQVPQEITLIARTDLEGELQKLYFAQTDSRHLDVKPRMELIDAVDADGDGRGELLFRQTSDAGSAYAIYRVTADGLWPLYEGTP